MNAGVTESKAGPVHVSMNVLTVHSISQYTADTNSAAWLQHEFFSARVSGSVSLSFTLALEVHPLEEKSAMKITFFSPTKLMIKIQTVLEAHVSSQRFPPQVHTCYFCSEFSDGQGRPLHFRNITES